MTSADLQRRYLIVRVAESVGSILLIVVGVVVAAANPLVGALIIGAGFAFRIVMSVLSRRLQMQVAEQTYLDEGSSRWWYDPRTGQVYEGQLPPLPMLDGPYATRADAERAPEIARERAAAWNAEDD